MSDKEIAKLIERQKVYAKLVEIDELLNQAKKIAWEVKSSFPQTSMASQCGLDIYIELTGAIEESDNATTQAFCQKGFCDKR